MESLDESVKRIQSGITEACRRSGRNPEEVTWVAVSKFVPSEVVAQVLRLGVLDLGESRVQEFLSKRQDLGIRCPDLKFRWHFIGRLQTNKVRQLLELTEPPLIHSVDRWELIERLQQGVDKRSCELSVLLQVNVSSEKTKAGFAPQTVGETLVKLRAEAPQLRVMGLMTMARWGAEEAEVRRGFALLRELRDEGVISGTLCQPGFLSMGMSSDYEWAVEEGATHLRLGSALFGERPQIR